METTPGLQPERTVLAWWRTAFSVIVAGALIIREAIAQSAHAWVVALCAGAGGLLLVVGIWRVRLLRRTVSAVALPRSTGAVFVGAVVALQALAFALVVT